jgi:molecular chaperone DnaJ
MGAPRDGAGAGGFTFRPGGGTSTRFEMGGADLGDLLGGFFGGGRRGAPERSAGGAGGGQDLQHEIEITLEEAYHGAERRLTITSPDACPTCHGTRAEPGARMETCPACRGTGRGTHWGGFNIGSGPCDRCQGTGQSATVACHTCRGMGMVERPRGVTVTIPKSVGDGSKLRIAGQGNPAPGGGPSGDLYLQVRVRPHALFERKEDDLLVELPVTFVEAALGAEVQVPTMTGKLTMKIPAGVQSGQQLRLGGQGMPKRAGGHGDLYARIKVVVPRNLSAEERGLIEKLSALRQENPRERILAGR